MEGTQAALFSKGETLALFPEKIKSNKINNFQFNCSYKYIIVYDSINIVVEIQAYIK
jgi:hypothetical protein